MSDMPKRMWACDWSSPDLSRRAEYVRADIAKEQRDELVEALRQILMWNGLKSSDGIRAIAREAIAKAEAE